MERLLGNFLRDPRRVRCRCAQTPLRGQVLGGPWPPGDSIFRYIHAPLCQYIPLFLCIGSNL
jgi:hypothetical protein